MQFLGIFETSKKDNSLLVKAKFREIAHVMPFPYR